MSRRASLVLGVVIGALGVALAGGIAWAAIPSVPGGVIQGCYDSGGNVKVVETGLPCPSKYTPFQWNQQGIQGRPGKDGTNGTNGVSVASASEPAGLNCANGGSKFTAATGVTYACDGARGPAGQDGKDGKDGQDGASCLPSNPACVGPQGPPGPAGGARAWAHVAADGTIIASTPGLTVEKVDGYFGWYKVFVPGINPNLCAVVGSAEGGAVVTPENYNIPNNGIWVFTFKDWNSITGISSEVDAYFNLAVFC